MSSLRPELPPLPASMRQLPVDHDRGYPVPWFVAWVNGKPDFRVADGRKREEAVRLRLCWVCGGHLYAHKAFVVGPMCTVNRVSAEPPCHRECAVYSAQACPFLVRPHAVRREAGMPDGTTVDGEMISRNPGVSAVWVIRGQYATFPDGGGGWLVDIGEPVEVLWFREGRQATRQEVEESIATGLPALQERTANARERAALEEQVLRARSYLPKEAA